jgi:hypothetical protein
MMSDHAATRAYYELLLSTIPTCDRCEEQRGSVAHRHDALWCRATTPSGLCGGNLCDECADALGEAREALR